MAAEGMMGEELPENRAIADRSLPVRTIRTNRQAMAEAARRFPATLTERPTVTRQRTFEEDAEAAAAPDAPAQATICPPGPRSEATTDALNAVSKAAAAALESKRLQPVMWPTAEIVARVLVEAGRFGKEDPVAIAKGVWPKISVGRALAYFWLQERYQQLDKRQIISLLGCAKKVSEAATGIHKIAEWPLFAERLVALHSKMTEFYKA